MPNVTTNTVAKVAAVVAGLALVMMSFAFVPSARAQTTADLQAQINALLVTIAALQAQLAATQGGSTGGAACSFSRDLTIGATGADVTCLQQALIGGGFSIPAGATGYFGTQTRAAVASWQSSKNIAPAVGYFGPISRAAFNLGGAPSIPGVPGVPVTGNGLKVMLAADSPNNIALVQGQAIGELAKFTFQNPTASEIKVTNLAFKRIGVSNDTTLTNIYLFNGALRITDSAGISNTAFNFNDSTGIFAIPAGGTVTIGVRADIAGSTSGQQVGVQLVSVGSTGTLDTSVSFPINSYTQTVSAATLAAVDFNTTTLPSVTTIAPQNDYTVWQNTVTVSTRSVDLTSFRLRVVGSLGKDDINNLRLYADGVQVGSAANLSVGGGETFVSWDLSGSPKRLETGGRVIKVVGDIVGGSDLTFQFSLRRASDANLIDTDLSQPVLATANGSTFSARSATSATIDSGTVSTVKANNSASSNVSVNAANVKWATFEMRAAGEDVKVENLNVRATASAGTRGLDNGKVFVNGVQVGSTKDLTDATDIEFTFGSSFILKAGATTIVDIYADAKSSTGAAYTSGETVAIRLSTGSSNGTGQVSLASINVPTANVTANTITISSSTLTLTKYSGYGNQTMIAGTNNAKLGSFTLSTGSTEGVNINTLTVALSSDESATITDLMLKDNATGAQIGTTKPSPSTSNAFSVNVNVGSSQTKTIDIYGNIKSGSNAGEWIANIDATGTGASTGTSVDADAVNLQTITLSSAVLTIAVNDGATPDAANVIAGSSSAKVGAFRFTAQYSSYTVQELKIKVPADAATSVTAVTLKYKDSAGVTQETSQALALSSGGQTHATATFTGLTFYVPQNTNADLDVYVGVPTIASGAATGKAISVVLDDDEGFKAVDSSGASDTDAGTDYNSAATSGKGTLYVRKSVPTLSAVALDSAILSEGSDQVLARVKITADAAGDIGWKYLSFTVNKTSAISLGATTTLALWDGSNEVGGLIATTTGALLGGLDSLDNLTSGNIVFEATSEQQIQAGTGKTYELRGTIGGTASGANNVSVSIANPTTSVSTDVYATVLGTFGDSTPSLIWTDRSSISTVHDETTSDWTNDYLVKTLPLTVGSRSLNF